MSPENGKDPTWQGENDLSWIFYIELDKQKGQVSTPQLLSKHAYAQRVTEGLRCLPGAREQFWLQIMGFVVQINGQLASQSQTRLSGTQPGSQMKEASISVMGLKHLS